MLVHDRSCCHPMVDEFFGFNIQVKSETQPLFACPCHAFWRGLETCSNPASTLWFFFHKGIRSRSISKRGCRILHPLRRIIAPFGDKCCTLWVVIWCRFLRPFIARYGARFCVLCPVRTVLASPTFAAPDIAGEPSGVTQLTETVLDAPGGFSKLL